jgi:hypothetical protein
LLLRSRETMLHAIAAQIPARLARHRNRPDPHDVIQLLALPTPGSTTSRPATRTPRRRACLTSQARRILDQGG